MALQGRHEEPLWCGNVLSCPGQCNSGLSGVL